MPGGGERDERDRHPEAHQRREGGDPGAAAHVRSVTAAERAPSYTCRCGHRECPLDAASGGGTALRRRAAARAPPARLDRGHVACALRPCRLGAPFRRPDARRRRAGRRTWLCSRSVSSPSSTSGAAPRGLGSRRSPRSQPHRTSPPATSPSAATPCSRASSRTRSRHDVTARSRALLHGAAAAAALRRSGHVGARPRRAPRPGRGATARALGTGRRRREAVRHEGRGRRSSCSAPTRARATGARAPTRSSSSPSSTAPGAPRRSGSRATSPRCRSEGSDELSKEPLNALYGQNGGGAPGRERAQAGGLEPARDPRRLLRARQPARLRRSRRRARRRRDRGEGAAAGRGHAPRLG